MLWREKSWKARFAREHSRRAAKCRTAEEELEMWISLENGACLVVIAANCADFRHKKAPRMAALEKKWKLVGVSSEGVSALPSLCSALTRPSATLSRFAGEGRLAISWLVGAALGNATLARVRLGACATWRVCDLARVRLGACATWRVCDLASRPTFGGGPSPTKWERVAEGRVRAEHSEETPANSRFKPQPAHAHF